MFKTWEKEIFAKTEEYKFSAEGKQELGMYRQCIKYSKPLFKLLKKDLLNTEILDGVYLIV